MAVELFVGRWILFGLRQSMAISSAIAARMSATGVQRGAISDEPAAPRALTFPMAISAAAAADGDSDGSDNTPTRYLVNNRAFVYLLNQFAFPASRYITILYKLRQIFDRCVGYLVSLRGVERPSYNLNESSSCLAINNMAHYYNSDWLLKLNLSGLMKIPKRRLRD